jgi:hypothetical protein
LFSAKIHKNILARRNSSFSKPSLKKKITVNAPKNPYFHISIPITMKSTSRRKFISTAALLTAATATTAATSAVQAAKTYPIAHHVFFWLKNPASTTERNQLIAGVKTLKKIPTIKALHVGVVADTEKRDVIDHTWGVSELLFFEDLAGQAAYQVHPIHLEFIKNYSHLWEKVVVYDIAEA